MQSFYNNIEGLFKQSININIECWIELMNIQTVDAKSNYLIDRPIACDFKS